MNTDSLLKQPLKEVQSQLKNLKAEERLEWARQEFNHEFVTTTSFGIQSSVLLHMLHKRKTNVQVIWVDTGYLPPETYKYAEQLLDQLDLNLKVVQSKISPARMEAKYGQLWKTGKVEDLEKYHQIRKVEPLESILENLKRLLVI